MNWLPKLIKIEINQNYCDGLISPTTTCTSHYYWTGQKQFNWLWFNFKMKYIQDRDFEVYQKGITFKDIPNDDVEVIVKYHNEIITKEIKNNRKQRRDKTFKRIK